MDPDVDDEEYFDFEDSGKDASDYRASIMKWAATLNLVVEAW